jgi:hypothetical protein
LTTPLRLLNIEKDLIGADPNSSSIGRFSSATIAIVGMQLTGSGLPAVRDLKCVQVNALVDLSAVIT